MATTIDLNIYDEAVKKYKKLLAQKDKLVKKESDDGRNQFQIKLNELKKSIKGQHFKFKDVMKDTLKQEREGKFDRGAEGKTKKKLRAKMGQEREELFTSGRHKGSDAAKYIKEKIPQYAKVPEKKKKESVAKSR
jgi:hypothetical protein|tara:strand:+ start:56 stop:460 length:405 start_codon:yes stop_codon:yes gene_type:complete